MSGWEVHYVPRWRFYPTWMRPGEFVASPLTYKGATSSMAATEHRKWNQGELRRVVYLWRWPRRWRCHGSVMPCQYTDDPNDNHA